MKQVMQSLALGLGGVFIASATLASTLNLQYMTTVNSQNFTINPDVLPVADGQQVKVGFTIDSDVTSMKAFVLGGNYDYFGDVTLGAYDLFDNAIGSLGVYSLYGITGTDYIALEQAGNGQIITIQDSDLSVSPFNLTAANYFSGLTFGKNTTVSNISYGSVANGGNFNSQTYIDFVAATTPVSGVPIPPALPLLAGGLGLLALARRRSHTPA